MRVRFIRDFEVQSAGETSETIRRGTIAQAVRTGAAGPGAWEVELGDGAFAVVELGDDVVVDCPCVCHAGSGIMHFVACC